MNCKCINEVDEKLKEFNLTLCGYAWIMPDFRRQITINTEWIDESKAPRGQKRKPTSMFASHCPFCGEKYPPGKSEADTSLTSAPLREESGKEAA